MIAIATLQLDRVWVNRLPNGVAISAYSAPDRRRSLAVDGEVRTYAGGRQRSITTEGAGREFRFALVQLTLAQVETLESWAGLEVQVRDHRGQRFFGAFYEVAVGEYMNGLYTVGLTLHGVTAEEGV